MTLGPSFKHELMNCQEVQSSPLEAVLGLSSQSKFDYSTAHHHNKYLTQKSSVEGEEIAFVIGAIR
jgi:hypothetical protein